MLSLLRRHKLFFLICSLLGILLRCYFLHWHFLFEGDSLIYGDLAKNWLVHGIYGLTDGGQIVPVDIRMPGYPAYLALCFQLFGVEHYAPVVRLQLAIDFLTCFLIAAGTRRLWSESAARTAFALAALCPFTANYTATPLPETLAIFFAAFSLLFALRAVRNMRQAPSWDVAHCFAIADWVLCGLGIAASIYLRPDGGVLLISICLYLLGLAISERELEFIWTAGLLALVSLLPLAPWALRNWRVLQQVEPLAPFYAQSPGEYVPVGFNRWSKTWVIDFISVMNVEWNVSTDAPGEALDIRQIPPRAYDNAEQKRRTEQLIAEYNSAVVLTPEMDRQFGQLAVERIRAHRARYYLELPLLRLADMWLRPRTEMLNLQLDWWNWQDVPQESLISLAMAALNVFYLVAALLSLRRKSPGSGLLWLFLVFRSALLATLPNPEPRYTLECFPAVLMLAGVGLARNSIGRADGQATAVEQRSESVSFSRGPSFR